MSETIGVSAKWISEMRRKGMEKQMLDATKKVVNAIERLDSDDALKVLEFAGECVRRRKPKDAVETAGEAQPQ